MAAEVKYCLEILRKAIILLSIIGIRPYVCTVDIRSRITHGNTARNGQFPWYVVIKEPGYSSIHCGGSLISVSWVVTAAHCLYMKPSLRFYFGSIMLRDPNAVTMWSQQFYINSGYDDHTYDNDVGLVKLPQPVQLNSFIQPIPLVPHTMAKENFIGMPAFIVGLGLLSDEAPNSYPSTIFFAPVIIIDNAVCQKKFLFPLPLSSMCSIGATSGNEKICDGDSGGGLIARNIDGTNILIGVNSFGSQKCTRMPSGYANIGAFLNWIHNITKLNLS